MLFLNINFMKKHISVISPCYNEEGNVALLVDAVAKVFEKLPQYTYEQVFIDNCSQDNTVEILRNIAAISDGFVHLFMV